jgi:hypothetical protein
MCLLCAHHRIDMPGCAPGAGLTLPPKTLTLPVVQLLVCAEGARCPIHDGVRYPNRMFGGVWHSGSERSPVGGRQRTSALGRIYSAPFRANAAITPRIRVTDDPLCICFGTTYAPSSSTPGTPDGYPKGDRRATERSGTSPGRAPSRSRKAALARRGGVLGCVVSRTDAHAGRHGAVWHESKGAYRPRQRVHDLQDADRICKRTRSSINRSRSHNNAT